MRTRRLRRLLRVAHLWLTLVTGLVAVVLGASGSLLVFREEIRGLLAPAPVWNGRDDVGWERVRDQARRAVPDGQLQILWFPTLARPYYEAAYKIGTHEFVGHRRWDAASGREVPVEEVAWLAWVEELHVNLHLGEVGRQAVHWCTLALGVLLLTGLYLWWPGWKPWLWLAVRRRGWLFTFDLHRVTGLAALVPLGAMTASGLVWAFPDAARTVAFALVGQRAPGMSARALGDVRSVARPTGAVPVSDSDLLAGARARVGQDAMPFYITFPTDAGEARQVRLQRGYEPWPYGDVLRVYFDQWTGEVLAVDVAAEKHPVDRVLDTWAAPLHFGTVGGRATMVTYAIAGLMPLALGVTGVLLWRWRVERPRRHTIPARVFRPSSAAR